MKQVREGNDISVIWSIMSNDAPVNLGSYELSLYLTSKFEKKKLKDFKTNGNKISWTFFGKDQTARGKYSLTLVLNEGKENMHTVDACDFIELVSCTCKVVNGVDKEGFETEVVELSSTMEFSKGEVEVDTDLSETSENPVQNKVVTAELKKKISSILANGAEYKPDENGQIDLGELGSSIEGLNFRQVYLTEAENFGSVNDTFDITEEQRAYNIETVEIAHNSDGYPSLVLAGHIFQFTLGRWNFGETGTSEVVFTEVTSIPATNPNSEPNSELVSIQIKINEKGDAVITMKEYASGGYDDTEIREEIAVRNVAAVDVEGGAEAPDAPSGGVINTLRWWLASEQFGIVNTPEQTQENIATYNKLVEDKYASVILCYGIMDRSTFSVCSSVPVVTQYAVIEGKEQMWMSASLASEEDSPIEHINVCPYPDGTMDVYFWQQPSAPVSNGPLRVWINEMTGGENNSEQIAENAETFKVMWNEKPQMAILCAAAGLGGFPMMIAMPVIGYRLISENGEDMISMTYRDIIDQGNGLEVMETYIYLKQDGTVTIEY